MSFVEDAFMSGPSSSTPSRFPAANSFHQVHISAATPFDLDPILTQFKGRGLLLRLSQIYSSCPSLRDQVRAAALPVVQAETFDGSLWDFFGGDPEDPWRQEVSSRARSELDKLETELKSVQANLIKESIRLCHMELGQLHLKCGDPQSALKSFTKTREFNSTGPQALAMAMSIIELDIYLYSYIQIPPYIVKAESALERPQVLTSTSSVPLSGAQARARAEATERADEERTTTQTRLQVARAISDLGQGLYERAARGFLAVSGDLGEWGSTVISNEELAIYGSLCAVATLRRAALKTEVLESDSFRPFLDDAPHTRELVDAFVSGKYKLVLELLATHSARHQLTPHLPSHLARLTALIRRRAFIQYFQPFETVAIARMAEAFDLPEEDVLRDVLELVGTGELEGRIDLPNKVLRVRKEDPRERLFASALRDGECLEAATRRVFFRMRLVEEHLIVHDPKAKQKAQQQMQIQQDEQMASALMEDF